MSEEHNKSGAAYKPTSQQEQHVELKVGGPQASK